MRLTSDSSRRADPVCEYLRGGYADPYDLWSMPWALRVRRDFYAGRLAGKVGAAAIAGADWLAPALVRRLLRAPRRIHPITAGLLAQMDARNGFAWLAPSRWQGLFWELAAPMGDGGTLAWGLGFPWMAKNGLYPPNVPFVTHSPYVMEALLRIAEARPREAEACMRMFDGTWRFLESLRLTVAAEGAIAASYSPRVEPRLVVNASSYAAWAYGMHASFGSPSRRDRAEYMATALCRWVVSQQQDDGTWFYFADRQPGNFMDVFHTCFVIRNLRKAAQHVSALRDIVSAPAAAGWKALKEQAYDADAGLVHRYLHRDFMDPYAWDLYDQAEYLGLLVDFGEIDAAAALQRNVTGHFSRGDDWWCRLDCFGRRWGKNFLRWGIVPFWYQSARLRDAARAAHARAA